jgi:hypothetical protein
MRHNPHHNLEPRTKRTKRRVRQVIAFSGVGAVRRSRALALALSLHKRSVICRARQQRTISTSSYKTTGHTDTTRL